ncbi:inositol monophosphatase family protein [Halopenitus salinus]|uniref:fructose-bisphosphatase n=1 Tax=Halopenitus salinus TaxID=1198295 RepID=A0ABD5UZ68_9EURY
MIDDADRDDRATIAERAAHAGARVAHEHFRTGISTETKSGKTDVVTAADRTAQREAIDVIRTEFPDDAIVGEEDDELKAVPESGAAWIIDPIDGTSNFVRDNRVWASVVAVVVDGEPVASTTAMPALEDVYTVDAEGAYRNGEPLATSDVDDPEAAIVSPAMWWEMDRRDEYARACEAIVTRFGDARRIGSAQALLASIADGGLEGAITNVETNPWDTVAGVNLIRQAGGRVTDLDGNRWRHDSVGLVASNGELHGELLEAANEIEG